MILSFNSQWLEVEGGVGNTQSKLFETNSARPLNKNFTRATWAEHMLGDKLVGAVDKDEGLEKMDPQHEIINPWLNNLNPRPKVRLPAVKKTFLFNNLFIF